MSTSKPRILCLHGMSQSGSILSTKISGARRKLSRLYELDFLDGPIALDSVEPGAGSSSESDDSKGTTLAWWKLSADRKKREGVEETFDYVREYSKGKHYDALLGFSQGGLLATALALSGDVPGVRAVVTAGAPYDDEPFEVARRRATGAGVDLDEGKSIPKLHFAGETDTIIPVHRVQQLVDAGGNGRLELHDKGHMFPTKAVEVNLMLSFLEEHLLQTSASAMDNA